MKKLTATLSSIFFILSVLVLFNCSGPEETSEAVKFYIGSSDGSLEYSIFLCEMDPVKGEFAVLDSFTGAKGPSYLAFSPDRSHLYTINKEISDTSLRNMTLSSFSINKETHQLEFLNSQSSEGGGPCHVHCSKKGTFLFTSNYSSGSVAAFPISDLGEIQPASSVVQSSGTGPIENRQGGPHTHYVSLDLKENYLLSPDLGTDKVLIYEFDHDSGVLTPNPAQPFFKLTPGAGPRHLVFHPSGEFVYVVNELNATVTACRYNDKNGTLTKLNVVSTIPEPYEGSRYPAAIRIHPNGNYVYASTRGDISSISVFKVDEEGEFYRIQVMENVTAWPRDFNIDPSGQYLMAAGERSDEIELYRIDKGTGMLTKTEMKITLPSPGCILYLD